MSARRTGQPRAWRGAQPCSPRPEGERAATRRSATRSRGDTDAWARRAMGDISSSRAPRPALLVPRSSSHAPRRAHCSAASPMVRSGLESSDGMGGGCGALGKSCFAPCPSSMARRDIVQRDLPP
jgi:hypothetical protein